MRTSPLKLSDLLFIGIKGSVVALDRRTGEQVWATHLKGWDYVNVVVHNATLLATCYGEVYCLDPLTGNGLWHNRLKGFGTGLASIAAEGVTGPGMEQMTAEKRRRAQQAAAAST